MISAYVQLDRATAPVGARRPASVSRTTATIEYLVFVLAQRPVALARPTLPAARYGTVPDAQRNDNRSRGTAEDAPARNGRPDHHLALWLLPERD
jgi:hypothetical protein